MPIVVDHMALNDILGPPVFDMEVSANRRRSVLVFLVLALLLFVAGVGAAHPARRGGGSGVDPPGWRAHVRGS